MYVKVVWKEFCVFQFGQTIDQFEFDGCENCEEYLNMKNNRDTVYECTSSSFDGFVFLVLFCFVM